MKKIKGLLLIEIILSIALLSILSLGLIKSLLHLSNLTKRQEIKNEMLNMCENIIESELSDISYKNSDYDKKIYKAIVSKEEYNDKLNKIRVTVTCEDIDYEVELQRYKQVED